MRGNSSYGRWMMLWLNFCDHDMPIALACLWQDALKASGGIAPVA
jgi:hypothetical protein